MNVAELKKRLRLRRRMRGLTQKELGILIDISEITLRRWESAKSSQVPSAANLCALAEVLETTVSYLTGETDEPSLIRKSTPVVDASGATVHAPIQAGNDNSVTMNAEHSEKNAPELPWWSNIVPAAYKTIANGDQREIKEALATVELVAGILRQAQP